MRSEEVFRIALKDSAKAKVITTKNQILITVLHLYFMIIEINAKARANEKMIERKVGSAWESGVSRPKGKMSFVYWEMMKSPMIWVSKNIPRRIKLIESLCFMEIEGCRVI